MYKMITSVFAAPSEIARPTQGTTRNSAATDIQRIFRGYHTRKQYKVTPLKQNELLKNPAFIRSNGPDITGLEKYQLSEGEQLVLIASTSLTAVEIACELGKKNSSSLVPKLILIDHGHEAAEFWRLFKKFLKKHASPTESFAEQIQQFLQDNTSLFHSADMSIEHQKQFIESSVNYIASLFQKYGHAWVCNIILNSTYFKQDWKDQDTFLKLKRMIDHNRYKNTIVYPTNIVSISPENVARDILENIDLLIPRLAIHQNQAIFINHPNKILFFENYESPRNILQTLKGEISFEGENISRIYLEGMNIYRATPSQYINRKFMLMQQKIDEMREKNHYLFDQYNSPFLIDLILKMAGIREGIPRKLYFEPSKYEYNLIFHLPVSKAAEYMKILNQKFAGLNAKVQRSC